MTYQKSLLTPLRDETYHDFRLRMKILANKLPSHRLPYGMRKMTAMVRDGNPPACLMGAWYRIAMNVINRK